MRCDIDLPIRLLYSVAVTLPLWVLNPTYVAGEDFALVGSTGGPATTIAAALPTFTQYFTDAAGSIVSEAVVAATGMYLFSASHRVRPHSSL